MGRRHRKLLGGPNLIQQPSEALTFLAGPFKP